MLITAIALTYGVHAQYGYNAVPPPRHLVKWSYTDGDRHIKLDSTYIDLELKDRFLSKWGASIEFDVMLRIKNSSRQNIYIPRHINCFEDSGFGTDRYFISNMDVLAPRQTKEIPVHVHETTREQLRKEGFIVLFTADSAVARFPIKLNVHFAWPDTTAHK